MGCGESKIKQISLTSERDWGVREEEEGVRGPGDQWRVVATTVIREQEVIKELELPKVETGGGGHTVGGAAGSGIEHWF